MFQSVVDIGVLRLLSEHPNVPDRFRDYTADEWRSTLDQAVAVGLLTAVSRGMYGIHPALPSFLLQQWRIEDADLFEQRHAAAEQALLDGYAAFGGWLLHEMEAGDVEVAFRTADMQRGMLSRQLAYATANQRWEQANAIAQPLNEFWTGRGLDREAGTWVDRIRLSLEEPDGTPPQLTTNAGALWLTMVGGEANRHIRALRLALAERTYLQIQDLLQNLPESSSQRDRLAVVYYQLGLSAQHGGDWDGADRWYRESLAIFDDLGGRPAIANCYRQLGVVARLRRQYTVAEGWYQKALTAFEQLGSPLGLASIYLQLGTLALEDDRLNQAEGWLRVRR